MSDRDIQECRNNKKHGKTEHYFETASNTWRCMKCRVIAVSKYRKTKKEKLVQQFGGQCEMCQYSKCNRALHFHHVFPETKEFGIGSKGICRSKESVQKEVSKCALLCSNCHSEVEEGVTPIPEFIIKRVTQNLETLNSN